MSESLVSVVLLALTAVCGAATPAVERDSPPAFPVRVVLYTVPGVSDRMLDTALEEAGLAFESAGVRVSWMPKPRAVRDADVLDNPVQRQFKRPDPACGGFPPGACVIAQLSDRFPATYMPKALGLSTPYGKDPGAVRVTVFLDRVQRTAARLGMPAARLLGAVLTHELGHVLSGTDAHGAGLMRNSWTLDDFHDIGRSIPRFETSEVRLLHMHLRGRPEAAETEANAVAPVVAGHP